MIWIHFIWINTNKCAHNLDLSYRICLYINTIIWISVYKIIHIINRDAKGMACRCWICVASQNIRCIYIYLHIIIIIIICSHHQKHMRKMCVHVYIHKYIEIIIAMIYNNRTHVPTWCSAKSALYARTYISVCAMMIYINI